jgi:hypothetical protein
MRVVINDRLTSLRKCQRPEPLASVLLDCVPPVPIIRIRRQLMTSRARYLQRAHLRRQVPLPFNHLLSTLPRDAAVIFITVGPL